jgi:serine/threonine protein kinase
MVEPVPPSTCPDSRVLAEFAAGLLPATQTAAVKLHIDQCSRCGNGLQELKRDEELSGRLRNALGLDEEILLRRRLEEATAGEYEILEKLGHGGGGMVFKCRDLKLHRLVAIKFIWPSSDGDSSVLTSQEARNLATISHPNIATIHAVSDLRPSPYIVMEFVDGVPITQALGNLPVHQQVDAFAQVLEAVAELHQRQLIHCDLKPANILMDHYRNVKLVDLGIARHVGSVIHAKFQGTPAYMAPEQGLGQPAEASADVFSLGIILFELLTGQRPFAGQTEGQVITAIRQTNPALPRSLRPEIPGALQAICLTALEKDPSRRYPSAKEFLLDLRRFIHGDAVSADPTLLTSVLEHGIERHVQDLRRWQKDRVISSRECDYFLDKYGRLRQREESWVLDSRRISFSQVILHLGVWSCAVSTFLMMVFPWPNLGLARPMLPLLLFIALLVSGDVLWRRQNRRVGIVLLMGASISFPIALATALIYFGWLRGGNADNDLLGEIITNRQLLAATVAWLALNLEIWRLTETAAFAVVCTAAAVAMATSVFALHDLRGQLANGHFDTIAEWYLTPGVLLFVLGMGWDMIRKNPLFAAPFYIVGLTLLLLSMTLIAYFGPTLQWLGWAPAVQDTTRQISYSFMINGAIYLAFGLLADRSTSSSWLRWIGSLLFWLAPSHLLIPILRLENQWPIAGTSWTLAEIILPIGALFFVFASVPKQMKSFFFSGLFYLAISLWRLTARHFENKFAWPLTIAGLGIILTLTAWRWPALFERRSDRRRFEG